MTKQTDRISKEQFDKYETIRLKGCYNMFDQRAIDETGLKKADYIFLLLNYNDLAKQYKKNEI